MMHLWQSEWIKTRKRPANLGILGVTLGIFLVAYVGMTIYGLVKGRGSEETSSVLLNMQYPGALNTAQIILASIGSLLGIIFMANIIGSEYSRDTWKMILPRRGSRLNFLWIKLMMTFAFVMMLMLVSMVFAQLLGFIGAAVLGGNLTTSVGTTLKDVWLSSVYSFIQISFSAMLTLFVTIVTRSTIGGIVGGFISYQIFGLATIISTIAARILPNMHLQNILGKWVIKEPELQVQAQRSFGMEISATTSLLVVIAYIAVFIGVSAWLFKRRDMAGS